MKKNQIIATIITAVMTITAATTTAMTAFAGSATGTTAAFTEYDLEGLDPNMAETKPTLALSRIELPINVAQENPVQAIELTVTGANRKYATTGLHIGYDERLTAVADEYGDIAEIGPAGAKLMRDQKASSRNDFFLTTGAASDHGKDGVLWTMNFQLPENIEVGDEFPIEILYRNIDGTSDLFSSSRDDDASKLMQAWVFTNGIEQGYIRITEAEIEEEELPEEPVIEEEPLVEESEEEELMLGDVNGDETINATDSSCILSTYALFQTGQDVELTPAQMKAADINRDGRVDAKDATDALRYYSYLSTGGTLEFMDFLAQ